MVTEFRSAEAEKMWSDFKALWATVNPNSTSYDFMQEPLHGGRGVDRLGPHRARQGCAAGRARTTTWSCAPPAGPKGRAYMPVIAGLAIAKGAPNRAGAVALIEHLTKPETQVLTAARGRLLPGGRTPRCRPISRPA